MRCVLHRSVLVVCVACVSCDGGDEVPTMLTLERSRRFSYHSARFTAKRVTARMHGSVFGAMKVSHVGVRQADEPQVYDTIVENVKKVQQTPTTTPSLTRQVLAEDEASQQGRTNQTQLELGQTKQTNANMIET